MRQAVVGDPDHSLAAFPDQHFQRKIEGNAWRGEHERCSRPGAAEDHVRSHESPRVTCAAEYAPSLRPTASVVGASTSVPDIRSLPFKESAQVVVVTPEMKTM